MRTVAVAGTGTISKTAAEELLADWLGYQPDDADATSYSATERAEEVRFVFLDHPDLVTQTVKRVYGWAKKARIDRIPVGEHDAVDGVFREAVDYLKDSTGQTYLLVLADMDSDGGADAGVDQLIIDAHEAGIRVLDLGSALMDYPVQKAVDRLDSPPAEKLALPEPPAQTDDVPEEAYDEPAPIPDAEPVGDKESVSTPTDRSLKQQVRRLAEVVDIVIKALDGRIVVDFYAERQALNSIREALEDAEEEKEPAMADEASAPGPQPPKGAKTCKGWWKEELREYVPLRGRPRSNVKVVDVYLDENTNTWKAAG
ncbi:hypothetical protein [Streptomyces sp. WZ-12]|uniref:hypothetical protein n=1 Tax=Streptomyces sp. WZ-12 TaxID=3030210 RepID=UPI002380D270|nr:hypothetical protein [Streptomyces sp. WZ-12]